MKRSVSALVFGAALVALLGGCGSVPRIGQASPVPTVPASSTPLASPTVSVPAASPTPPVTTSPTASSGTTYRLPVWGAAFVLQGNQARGMSGGFIAVPGGQFTLAQETVTDLPAEQVSGWTYSASLGHWLPVRRQAVSPDGNQYAYVEYLSSSAGPSQRIHIVDGRTKSDRVLVSSGGLDWPDWQGDALYVVHHFIGSDFGRGLARVDITTGAVTEIPVPQLTGAHGDWTVSGGAAWATDWTPGLPPLFGFNNRLQRYDLSTGQLTTWYYQPNTNIALSGFTATFQPMVEIEDVNGSSQLSNAVEATIGGPNSIASSFIIPGLPRDQTLALDVMPDATGLWLLHVNGGVWHVWPGGSPEKVSDANGVYGIGGPCLVGG